jgi:transposase-like protein
LRPVQVAYALKQAEGDTAVADVYREFGISEATFYVWKKKYRGARTPPPRERAQSSSAFQCGAWRPSDMTRLSPARTRGPIAI